MTRTPATPDATGAARRLLLAEDDPALAEMLAELLTAEGYDVDVARDGPTALRLALTGRHEVTVLDRGLPFLDGLTVVRRLRNAGWTAPVLVLSAYGTPQDRAAGAAAGVDDYLTKPFDIEDLLARLRALLHPHRELSGRAGTGGPTRGDFSGRPEICREACRHVALLDPSGPAPAPEPRTGCTASQKAQVR